MQLKIVSILNRDLEKEKDADVREIMIELKNAFVEITKQINTLYNQVNALKGSKRETTNSSTPDDAA